MLEFMKIKYKKLHLIIKNNNDYNINRMVGIICKFVKDCHMKEFTSI